MTSLPASDPVAEPVSVGTTKCAVCGLPLRVYVHPEKPGRVVAYCNHGDPTKVAVAVYESDAEAEQQAEAAPAPIVTSEVVQRVAHPSEAFRPMPTGGSEV